MLQFDEAEIAAVLQRLRSCFGPRGSGSARAVSVLYWAARSGDPVSALAWFVLRGDAFVERAQDGRLCLRFVGPWQHQTYTDECACVAAATDD